MGWPHDRSMRDKTLDAWRGLSVLLVIASHLLVNRYPAVTSGHPALVDFLNGLGALGVKFFFVISGYIITKLLLEERARTGTLCLRAFYVRRAFRILPALWTCVAVVALAHELGWAKGGGSLGPALLFLCNTQKCEWFVGHLWSLAIEEQFYLVWPVALLVGLPAVATSFWALAIMLFLAQASLLFTGFINNGLAFACIAAGCLYASSDRLRLAISTVASVPVLLAAAALLFARPLIPLAFPGQFRLHDMGTPALACLLVFGVYRHESRLQPVIRPLSALGLVSYGLYLWQQLFLGSEERYVAGTPLAAWPLFPVIAIVSYRWMERPLMRIGHRIAASLGPAKAAAPTMRA